MSEYQYYEFQAIDRRLTPAEMQELRGHSSRAQITATRFVNEYHWGDFKGDEDAWMDKYFDAFLYFANWGTRTLKFRLPAHLVEPHVARDYGDGHALALRHEGQHIVLTFHSDSEGAGCDSDDLDGAGLLASLVPVRAGLARGDLRALYLGWLAIVQEGDLDDEAVEPPMPAGLAQLDGSLEALADFLRIDRDLLEVAAQASAAPSPGPAAEQIARWVAALPAAEKDRLLAILIVDPEDRGVAAELCQRFREAHRDRSPAALESRRTVGVLLQETERRKAAREQADARRAAGEKAERERAAAAARARQLDRLAGQEARLWGDVERLIVARLPKSYDEAVQRLIDLRDLAERSAGAAPAEFAGKIQAFRAAHARKPSLLERLARAGL